ncbi:MAG: adenylate/guanylate cyclase domain-containing protein [Cyanobacteria bacterium P01_A01_bin.114]
MTHINSSVNLSDSNVDQSLQLSPGVAYYLRRLLRQNLERLSLKGSSKSASAAILTDLERLLQGRSELALTLQQLEMLAQQHQVLSNQGLKQRQPLRETEAQIFSYLGLQLTEDTEQPTILIVDDMPDNLRLLTMALTQQGYSVRSAINGALALSSAQRIKPDLILLDITMPGLDGYEVCERLKADPKTSDIPIIFISALDSALDKVKAFSLGGVDYITKPFQIEEVLVRIEHQLKLWNLQKRLEEQSLLLQQEITERQQSEERSQRLFERAVSGLYRLAPDGEFLSVNTQLAELYGYDTPEDFMARVTAPTLYVNPGQYAIYVHQIALDHSLTDFESQVYRRDGRKLWIAETARAVHNEQGELLYYEGTVIDISARKQAEDGWRRGRRRTKRLLLTLFPKSIAQQFARHRYKARSIAARFSDTTVLVADIVGATALTRELDPADFTALLNQIIFDFDRLAEKLNVEPIKVMGTRYLAVAGVPNANPDHSGAIAELALGMQQIMAEQQKSYPLHLRIGLHSGPVVAGVIGRKKLSYDIWGDTVDLASRLDQETPPGRIQVSAPAHHLLKGRYQLIAKSPVSLANETTTPTYWLEGRFIRE